MATPSDANSKLLKLSDEEFGNVQMKMEMVPYKAAVESFMYIMVDHMAGPRICRKYGESIHGQGWSVVLDGRETYLEVFGGEFGTQTFP